jgi:hypothetical protein
MFLSDLCQLLKLIEGPRLAVVVVDEGELLIGQHSDYYY